MDVWPFVQMDVCPFVQNGRLFILSQMDICSQCPIIYILVEFSFRKGRFLALSPKSYYSINTETNEMKAGHKGVPHVEAQKFTIDHFASCLYDGVIPKVIARELRRNKKHQMIYSETSKRGLNPVFKKFPVQSDKISCLPLSRNGKIL